MTNMATVDEVSLTFALFPEGVSLCESLFHFYFFSARQLRILKEELARKGTLRVKERLSQETKSRVARNQDGRGGLGKRLASLSGHVTRQPVLRGGRARETMAAFGALRRAWMAAGGLHAQVGMTSCDVTRPLALTGDVVRRARLRPALLVLARRSARLTQDGVNRRSPRVSRGESQGREPPPPPFRAWA